MSAASSRESRASALLLRPPSDLTEDEQRSSLFERLAHAFVLLEGAIDVDLSSVEVATRRGEQAPAPRGGCACPRPIDRAALLFQTVDQRLRGPELPERDQRFGLVRHARDHGGLDGSHLFQVANDRREMLVGSFMIGERQLEEPQHGPVPARIEQVVVRRWRAERRLPPIACASSVCPRCAAAYAWLNSTTWLWVAVWPDSTTVSIASAAYSAASATFPRDIRALPGSTGPPAEPCTCVLLVLGELLLEHISSVVEAPDHISWSPRIDRGVV